MPVAGGGGAGFLLDDAGRTEVAKRCGAQNRLGFALLLTAVRSLGTFLSGPLAVPTGVLDCLAEQLVIIDASCVSQLSLDNNTPRG